MGPMGDSRGARVAGMAAAMAGCLVLANCAATDKLVRRLDPKYGVAASPRVVPFGQPIPKGGGVYRTGKPYVVGGRTYVPNEGKGYRSEGIASWYGTDFHGRLTANGEVFDMESISAAHPTLPMPSYARVTRLDTGRSIIVRVNDRGPYERDREIDLSNKAAYLLGFHGRGTARVRVEYVGPAPIEGSDDRMLAATLRDNVPAPAPSRVMVASARPFVPTMQDPAPVNRPMTVSEQRPFTLPAGRYDEPQPRRVASVEPQLSDLSSARHAAPGPTLSWNRSPEPAVMSSPLGRDAQPVASFAPGRNSRNDPIGGLISGRGLY